MEIFNLKKSTFYKLSKEYENNQYNLECAINKLNTNIID